MEYPKTVAEYKKMQRWMNARTFCGKCGNIKIRVARRCRKCFIGKKNSKVSYVLRYRVNGEWVSRIHEKHTKSYKMQKNGLIRGS